MTESRVKERAKSKENGTSKKNKNERLKLLINLGIIKIEYTTGSQKSIDAFRKMVLTCVGLITGCVLYMTGLLLWAISKGYSIRIESVLFKLFLKAG